ncbi:MAG TPA: sigma-70 family RNA polymerase sigma factor [Candidatus Angelobacter sp.]|jgi:RNA polymerase sigma-70 factor (ECF subfamily)|nr:sigma-70 family RNA polymerase sigma factor [Candidatus Angelobacter sp.]
MEVTDAAVVAQVLAGDRDAFRVLVERHSRSIFRVVYRMTGNQQDAEELVQETFLRAYKSLERFELRANFSTWVYRIAVNRTLDFLNARKTQMQNQNKDSYQIVDNPDAEAGNQIQLPASSPGPDRLLLSVEMKSKIAGALGLLTAAERVAFTMRHMEGRSIEEISQVLDLKVSAAKNSVFRAVQKLRQQLEPYASAGRSAVK